MATERPAAPAKRLEPDKLVGHGTLKGLHGGCRCTWCELQARERGCPCKTCQGLRARSVYVEVPAAE